MLRFTPGNEARLRVGVDRPVGDGSFSISVTYSKFGKDQADSTSFATGDRAMAQSAFVVRDGGGSELLLSAWDLYRASGQQLGAPAPWENVANGGVAVGFHGAAACTSSRTSRSGSGTWTATRPDCSPMPGIRLRFDVAGLSVNPSAGYSFGSLYNVGRAGHGRDGVQGVGADQGALRADGGG